MNDITQTGIILVALNALGFFLKNHAPWLNNRYIPTVLLAFGVIAQVTIYGFTPQNAIEGLLASIGAVGGHSFVKNTLEPNRVSNSQPAPPPADGSSKET